MEFSINANGVLNFLCFALFTSLVFLGYFINRIADYAVIVFIELVCRSEDFPMDLKLIWEKSAQEIVNSQRTEKVEVLIRHNELEYEFTYYREPWLEFMELFEIEW